MWAQEIIVSVLLLASAVSPFSPLQYERKPGFPSHAHLGIGKTVKSDIFTTFTKSRLPTNVLPVSYALDLSPILDENVGTIPRWTAPGSVRIVVNVTTEPTKTITLNAVGLTIDGASITVMPVDPLDTTTFVVTPTADPENEFYHLGLDNELLSGHLYEAYIEFVSPVATTSLYGLYRSSYVDPATGEPSYVAVTQFEATAARQAFPCFDEPWIKATFNITIGFNKDKYIALGNGELAQQSIFPGMPTGWVKNEFKETVKMSTYLVAIIVADFKVAEAAAGLFEKPVKVYGPPSLIDNGGGQYAADTAAKLLDFYQDYYGIEYKLDKMDSVAVTDFEFGAMENWGLNIYREALLLEYAGGTTEEVRHTITLVLAHELSHQWFGNLVTCQWWSYMWLNEGFATYNEFIGTQATNPEFDYYALQQNDALQLAMVTDGNPAATHPLVNGAKYNQTNVEIFVNFDRITYQKGGALIRMMEGFLGKDVFKAGLIRYLNTMSFQGAHQDDVFNALNEQALIDGVQLPDGASVRDIMNTWSLQTGFPVVRVTRGGDSLIYVSQERLSDGVSYADESELDPNELWTIPVAVATADNPDFENTLPAFWIEKNVILTSASYDTTKWLVINAGSTGYYRVLYDTPLLDLLINQLDLDSSVISQFTRSQLIDDYFTFAAQKFTEIENALRFTKYLGSETQIVVWNAVMTHLRGILNKLGGTPAFDELKNYLVPRLGQALASAQIGLEQPEGDKGARVILRLQLLDWACALEHSECREYASRLFTQWMAEDDPQANPIPIDIRPVMYCGAVAADSSAFSQALSRYKAIETSVKDKGFLLSALACSSDTPQLLNLLLQVLADDSVIASNSDKITLLQKLAGNAQVRTTATGFVKDNAAELIAKLTTRSVIAFVGALSIHVGTADELANIKSIIAENSFTEGELNTLNGYVSAVEGNIVWRAENEERLRIWFSENISSY